MMGGLLRYIVCNMENGKAYIMCKCDFIMVQMQVQGRVAIVSNSRNNCTALREKKEMVKKLVGEKYKCLWV